MEKEVSEVLATLKGLEKSMNERFDGIEKRFDRIDEKAGNISGDLKKMIELLREQNKKLDEDSK